MRDKRAEKRWVYGFSENLGHRIRKSGMTQLEVAEKTGISKGSITRYVNGLSIPSAYHIYKIAEAINCDVNELV